MSKGPSKAPSEDMSPANEESVSMEHQLRPSRRRQQCSSVETNDLSEEYTLAASKNLKTSDFASAQIEVPICQTSEKILEERELSQNHVPSNRQLATKANQNDMKHPLFPNQGDMTHTNHERIARSLVDNSVSADREQEDEYSEDPFKQIQTIHCDACNKSFAPKTFQKLCAALDDNGNPKCVAMYNKKRKVYSSAKVRAVIIDGFEISILLVSMSSSFAHNHCVMFKLLVYLDSN